MPSGFLKSLQESFVFQPEWGKDSDKDYGGWTMCTTSVWHCMCVHIQSLSCVRLFATPRTVASQAPLSIGVSKQEHWSEFATSSSRGSSWPRNRSGISWVSCTGRRILYHCATWESPIYDAKKSNNFNLYFGGCHMDLELSFNLWCKMEKRDFLTSWRRVSQDKRLSVLTAGQT